jgi:hypothetical protein
LTSPVCDQNEHPADVQLKDVPVESVLQDVAVESELQVLPVESALQDVPVVSELHEVPAEFDQKPCAERRVRDTSDKCVGESSWGDTFLAYGIFDIP